MAKMTATQKMRNLVSRQISRMEKSGYRFDTGLKESIKSAKYQTLKSLRDNRYKKLYSSATAEIDGDTVSGSQYRQFVRREAARKASETRRNKHLHVKTEEEIQWEEQRRQQDEFEKGIADQFDQGQIVYNNVTSLIDKFPGDPALSLEKGLENEIKNYGLNNVMYAMGNVPERLIEEARNILYYQGSKADKHRAYKAFFDIIKGTINSLEENKEIGDVLDKMTDMSADS